MPGTSYSRYDVVVVGGGHNALTAAAYLARAGLSVLVLERLGWAGGAAVNAVPFEGWSCRFSRYADRLSLLPQRIADDLGLRLRTVPAPSASYAPVLREGRHRGLLVERPEGKATRASFAELTGSNREYDAWCTFWSEVAALARAVAPTLLEPLPLEKQVAAGIDEATWRDFVTTPLGHVLERRFSDDTVRGLVAAGAMAGDPVALDSPALSQNRAFLYRSLGEARYPVGGMGAVSEALARAASEAGAEIRTGAGVSAVRPGDDEVEVDVDLPEGRTTITGRFVLANVAPWILHILLGEPDDPDTKPHGSRLTVDLLVTRLPRLRSGVDPAVAFGGVLHLNQGYAALASAHADAARGLLPRHPPGEVHCASLADPSAVTDAPRGTHTLTWTGHHAPAHLFDTDHDRRREEAVRLALGALEEHLAEPLDAVLARDPHGRPCVDARTPHDVERELALPGGHPTHGDLDWPWAGNRARLDTPDQAWGVATGLPRVLLAGAGARRGGGVSGIAGHNAAQAVLASR